MASREFEEAEVRLLVDAVQSSRFITQKKTGELIRKIEGLVSTHQAKRMQWQVYVAGRIKAMNESIYYQVDRIHNAINDNRQIRFHYYEWALGSGRERVVKKLRHEGRMYQVSPWALLWDNENYYMVAYDGENRQLRHYRVDKMQDVESTDEPRLGKEAADGLDPGVYARRMFGMYNGTEETVRLRLENSLLSVVVDRFGKDLIFSNEGDGHFSVSVHAVISPQFYSWVFGLGEGAEILSPASVREEYLARLSAVMERMKH